MMTFMVDGNFMYTAKALHYKHLGKQRTEAYQILQILLGKSNKWTHHPAVHMWVGYIDGLKYYINCMIHEWVHRGYTNTMEIYVLPPYVQVPWWTQWSRLHQSHRAMLLRKNPYYATVLTVEPEYQQYGYIWPTKVEDVSAPLCEITAPIPPDLIAPRYCSKKIARTGECCGILLHDAQELCKVHAKK